MQMKSTSAAWELLVCIGIGLLISGISDGLSNFFVVVTCIAVAVSWLTFSNVPAGLLFLLMYLFLLMVSLIPVHSRLFCRFKFISSREDSLVPGDWRRSFLHVAYSARECSVVCLLAYDGCRLFNGVFLGDAALGAGSSSEHLPVAAAAYHAVVGRRAPRLAADLPSVLVR